LVARSKDSTTVVIAFAWFFAALSMLALLTPPGATHDEAYHLRSIWCGRGERSPFCSDRYVDEADGYVARTNLEVPICQVSARAPLHCPGSQTGETISPTDEGRYPPVFYFLLSWLVTTSTSASVVLMRVAVALSITMILGLMMWLFPSEHRKALFLVIMTVFPATGVTLFASINPSAWSAIGVGTGWLALHAALVPRRSRSPISRLGLAGIGLTAMCMAISSREDASLFLLLPVTFVAVDALRWNPRQRRLRLLPLVLGPTSVLVVGLWQMSLPAVAEYLQSLFSYSDGQSDNYTFYSENLLQALPNALHALGSLPMTSPVLVPEIVLISNLAILAYFLIRSYNAGEVLQKVGAVVSVIYIAVMIATQVALIDSRDFGGVEPRYVYPLFLFVSGWWFLQGNLDFGPKMADIFRVGSRIATASFALVCYSLAERYVDRQTFSFRYLPDGPDNWWWDGMPVGPTVIVVLASVFIWMFFRRLRCLLAEDPRSVVTS